ncbi:MAG: GntR family transcriptional regulator [Pseudomonadales bacterium]
MIILLHNRVIESIKKMIVEGELEPDTRVNEKMLCEKLSISRTPLREALKALSIEGLITLLPNRGAWVTKISNEDMVNLFSLMGALESLAGELAVERATDEEIEYISKLHDEMMGFYEKKDIKSYYSLNKKIHQAIVDFSRNDHLKQVYMITGVKINRVRFLIPIDEKGWNDAVLEHECMVNSLKRRDKETMALVMKKHLDTKINHTVKQKLSSIWVENDKE